MHIGTLGFGKMGRSIAERLIEKGHQITATETTAQQAADAGWAGKDISLLAAWRKHQAS